MSNPYEYDCVWQPEKKSFYFGIRFVELMRLIRENPKMAFRLTALRPESAQERKFFEGAVLQLWAYLDGANYKDWHVVHAYKTIVKREYAGETFIANGKTYTLEGSTKGKLGGENGIIEKVIQMLEEQYGIDRLKVLNPKHFKDWKDRIYSTGDFDHYIDYLISIKYLQ